MQDAIEHKRWLAISFMIKVVAPLIEGAMFSIVLHYCHIWMLLYGTRLEDNVGSILVFQQKQEVSVCIEHTKV